MKITSSYSPEINTALQENFPNLEFSENAEITLPKLKSPIRLGELLDFITAKISNTLQIGVFSLDTAKNTITHNNKTIDLTDKETAILKHLAQTGPASRDQMLKTIWGYSENADSKTVETHIHRLRQKITDTFAREIIITENGTYKLTP